MLVRQTSYHTRKPASVVSVGYFSDKVSLYAWALLDCGIPICASPHSRMITSATVLTHQLRWGFMNFCHAWP
jgi:CO dehydrogenase/acetyl-CoA synthase alpha subunit